MPSQTLFKGGLTFSPSLSREDYDLIGRLRQGEKEPETVPVKRESSGVSMWRNYLPIEMATDQSKDEVVLWWRHLVETYLKPRGYTLEGNLDWSNDQERGRILVDKNVIKCVR
jgi:hypothetical protein